MINILDLVNSILTMDTFATAIGKSQNFINTKMVNFIGNHTIKRNRFTNSRLIIFFQLLLDKINLPLS